MNFNRFEILLIGQLILLSGTALVVAWAIVNPHLQFSVFYFFIIFLMQLVFLFYNIRRQLKKIRDFLVSQLHGEVPAIPKGVNSDKVLSEIYDVLQLYAEKFEQVKSDKETEFQFFQAVIRHINIGIVVMNQKGEIILMNDAATRITGLNKIRHIIRLNTLRDGFANDILKLKSGKPRAAKIKVDGQILQVSVRAATIRQSEQELKIISLQDIRNELQQEEIETWQKLISILRHEIMNSISPITSLSKTLVKNFDEFNADQPEDIHGFIKDSAMGLRAIEKRSSGLMHFVESYRQLTRIPDPVIEEIRVCDLLNLTKSLMTEELTREGAALNIDCHNPDLVLLADEKLISQVMVNLIKNAVVAVKHTENKIISIHAIKQNDAIQISVADNGEGIPPENLDQVFLPFFTTRKEGSGIGLSLCKQIMMLHGGSIRLKSELGHGTMISLQF